MGPERWWTMPCNWVIAYWLLENWIVITACKSLPEYNSLREARWLAQIPFWNASDHDHCLQIMWRKWIIEKWTEHSSKNCTKWYIQKLIGHWLTQKLLMGKNNVESLCTIKKLRSLLKPRLHGTSEWLCTGCLPLYWGIISRDAVQFGSWLASLRKPGSKNCSNECFWNQIHVLCICDLIFKGTLEQRFLRYPRMWRGGIFTKRVWATLKVWCRMQSWLEPWFWLFK